MASLIKVEAFYGRHQSFLTALLVASDQAFPLVVGCSLKCPDGEVVDIPHRYLKVPGTVFYGALDAPDACCLAMPVGRHQGWAGQVMFALWADDRFTIRLADTGWLDWHAPYLLGTSGASLDNANQLLLDRYGEDWEQAWVS